MSIIIFNKFLAKLYYVKIAIMNLFGSNYRTPNKTEILVHSTGVFV